MKHDECVNDDVFIQEIGIFKEKYIHKQGGRVRASTFTYFMSEQFILNKLIFIEFSKWVEIQAQHICNVNLKGNNGFSGICLRQFKFIP